jgi:hypothetical protein
MFTHACVAVHMVMQVPQVALVVRSASQPLAPLPSQLARLVAHTGTHTPAAQLLVVVPAGVVQLLPQAPQWVLLVRMSVSQPLLGLPSQSRKPVAHTGTHTPAVQVLLVVPLGAAHMVPQAPQFELLVRRLTSHPSVTLVLQLRKLVLQLPMAQVPVVQVPVAFGGAQARPQVPQLVVVRPSTSQPSGASELQSR